MQVLELVLSPITIIRSTFSAKDLASSCLSAVALHIVSKITAFVHSFLIIFKLFFHSDTSKVVCDTTVVITGDSKIAGYAFYECRNATSLTIPEGMTTIEDYTFYNCTSLKTATIHGEEISSYAFYNTNLVSIEISENVNIGMDKIISLNDAIENELSVIRVGQEIIITQPEPPLSVERQEQVYYEEDYEADIVYVDNDEWYTTKEVTLQEPSAGHRKVAVLVFYRNDKEVSREILKEEVVMEAVPKIVEKGTKIPPTYIKPINGGRLTSTFGGRKDPITGKGSSHTGTDWAVPKGTAVYASSGGTVTKASWGGSYGNVIYIKHPDGRETRYAHLSKILVSSGQTVKQGQKIGLSGSTGRSTGPHLHFEIRINGSPVNALKYIQ